jgi:hypothetical protein
MRAMSFPWSAGYFFAVALVLALLEIQIEGPHGWAERLPTWRWDGPGVRRWLGKPVTGYHLCLNLMIVLLLHLPVLGTGSSLRVELEIFSMYSLLCVSWDFLWFALNPHFGWRRFRPEHVWWFRGWWWGVPRAYVLGLAISAASYVLAEGTGAWRGRTLLWGLVVAQFAAGTALALLVAGRRRASRPAPAPSRLASPPLR